MKTKFYWFALLASAALISQAQAGGHHGGGGFVRGGGGHISSPGRAAGPSFHSAPHANFGGGRFGASGQRFSSMGRSSANAFRQHSINSSGNAAIGTRQFRPGNFNRSGLARFGNNRQGHLAQSGNRVGQRNGAVGKRDGQGRNGNNLPANWRNHIAGQRSGNWHRDWDRGRDHFWHGHRCRFVNGSWFIFDFGFPYDYGYPYDYYAGDYYGDQYDSGVYEGDSGDYYGQGAYDSSDESTGSTVGAAQAQLSRQGYYEGKIDGVYGAATRRAVMRYQSDHGLRVTGSLNNDTLQALGLPQVANN